MMLMLRSRLGPSEKPQRASVLLLDMFFSLGGKGVHQVALEQVTPETEAGPRKETDTLSPKHKLART